MYADNMDDAIRKNVANTVVNTVVQQLVEKKKLLAESESLPSNHYDEAVGMLHEWGIQSIKREALKKRVNRSFHAAAAAAAAAAAVNPSPPIPPAVEVARNESPSSAISSSITWTLAATSVVSSKRPPLYQLLPIRTIPAILQGNVVGDLRAPLLLQNMTLIKIIRYVSMRLLKLMPMK